MYRGERWKIRTNLINARKAKGLKLKEIAEMLGITVRAYQHYETGDRTPSIEKINTLEDLFNLPQRQLLKSENETIAV